MTEFFLFAVLGLAGATAFYFVLRPLLLKGELEHVDTPQQITTRVFKSRSDELTHEIELGKVDGDSIEGIRAELERAYIADMRTYGQANNVQNVHPRVFLATLMLAIICALGLYALNSENAAAVEFSKAKDTMHSLIESIYAGSDIPEDLEDNARRELLRALQADLARPSQRDHENGWHMLGRLYLEFGRSGEAAYAFQQALALSPQNPDHALGLIRVELQANANKPTPELIERLKQLVARNPDHEGASMLLAYNAFHLNQFDDAVFLWERILAKRDPDSASANMLRKAIVMAQNRQASLNDEQEHAENSSESKSVGHSINIRVEVVPALQNAISENATLFVFAKAKQGPPMPLAVARLSVTNWPISVTLDGTKAMMPQLTLDQFEQVTVGARITQSGKIELNSGDFFGEAVDVDFTQTSEQQAKLLINTRQP